MIGYSVIVIVSLIYLHSINAQSETTYITNPGQIYEELREEIGKFRHHNMFSVLRLTVRFVIELTFDSICPFLDYVTQNVRRYQQALKDHHDFICDSLDERKKQSMCDKIMVHMVNEKKDGVFESFVGTTSSHSLPELYELFSKDSYTCQDIYIETFLVERRMYWCGPRQYKTVSGDDGEVEGFFCAGPLRFVSRVFAFRAPQVDSDSVEPVGQIRGVGVYENL